ncbi:MAG: hypothetical protein ACLRR6_08150 [Oscillospiraceae bacterium]
MLCRCSACADGRDRIADLYDAAGRGVEQNLIGSFFQLRERHALPDNGCVLRAASSEKTSGKEDGGEHQEKERRNIAAWLFRI